jgi:OOP family OmpA-OmpF porin
MKRIAKTVGTLGLVGCAVIASPFAVADDSGWYGGINAGQSKSTIDDTRINSNLLGAGATSTTINDNNHDTGYKLYGGYKFNRNFALEAGYFNLGKFGYTATTVPAGTLVGNTKLEGVNLDVLGILPITEKFSAFARVGVNYAETRDNFTSTGAAHLPANPNPSKQDANLKFGMGVQYDFTQSLGMRAEGERYRISDAIGNKGDIDLVSLGLVYRFGVKTPAPVPVQKVAAIEPVVVAPVPKAVVVIPPPPVPKKVVFSADSSADSLFAFDTATLNPGGKQALDKFAADLTGADFDLIKVTGHSDKIGPAAYNMKLSKLRAEAVMAYLVQSAGIPNDKLEGKGMGDSEPVTKPGECKGKRGNKLIACLAPDRRVEVEVNSTRTSN